jgi:hypothetical protein
MRVGICVAGLCRAKESSISAASGALKDMAERTGLDAKAIKAILYVVKRLYWGRLVG